MRKHDPPSQPAGGKPSVPPEGTVLETSLVVRWSTFHQAGYNLPQLTFTMVVLALRHRRWR